MSKNNTIKFFTGYVGSKARWVNNKKLIEKIGVRENHIVELFCGSAVIPANLAKTCLLVDKDPIICKILSEFDHQIVPEVFTAEDYFVARDLPNWWQYIYCLQKMSFSGVFRYNAKKNIYNVPIKKNPDGTYYKKEIKVYEEYLKARKRWIELKPEVRNYSYTYVPMSEMKDAVVILDPPYEGSKAAYNKDFNYDFYWRHVRYIQEVAKVVVLFDRVKNIRKRLGDDVEIHMKKLRVNGKYAGDEEGMVFLEK
jgi:site-specific DNA-adenine methylase